MSMSKTDTGIKYVWYRFKKIFFRVQYAKYVMATGPKPRIRHFTIRTSRNRIPQSDY